MYLLLLGVLKKHVRASGLRQHSEFLGMTHCICKVWVWTGRWISTLVLETCLYGKATPEYARMPGNTDLRLIGGEKYSPHLAIASTVDCMKAEKEALLTTSTTSKEGPHTSQTNWDNQELLFEYSITSGTALRRMKDKLLSPHALSHYYLHINYSHSLQAESCLD